MGKSTGPLYAFQIWGEGMIRSLFASLARQGKLRKIVMSTPGFRDLAWRFVAGENLDAGIEAIRSLNEQGIQGTLNFVGTHFFQREEALSAADAAIATLEKVSQERLACHLSLKLTQIGLDIEEDFCRDQLRRVLYCAKAHNVFVRIDMEEHPYVNATLELFEEARETYGSETVGIAIQSYLRNREGDLEQLLAGGSRIRLVKGGYWEPGSVAVRSKQEIDRLFDRDLELLMANGTAPAIATHDPHFIERTIVLAKRYGRSHQDFEFQMLYGVRPDLQKNLVTEGFNLRCYVPYGGHWVPYFFGCLRRLPEGALRKVQNWGAMIKA